uniref:Uncharacterized protein n=1 Tax=Anguilla anguilla TaxID=7936 RepID=A0A0E9Q8C0_ANGAN
MPCKTMICDFSCHFDCLIFKVLYICQLIIF